MKIVVMGDLHITERPATGALDLNEQQQLLDKYVAAVRDENPAMVIITGDVFQGRTNPIERVVAMTFVDRLKQICPVKIVRGNHDQQHDLLCLGTAQCILGCSTHESPRMVGENILLLPWEASREKMLEMLERHYGKGIELVFGHIEVSEVMTGNSNLLGEHSQSAVSIHDLFELGAQYYGLGHIHSAQRFGHPETRAVIEYTGSIRPTAYGHGSDEHGYVVLDNSSGRWESVRKIIDCPRMVTIRINPDGGAVGDGEPRDGDAIKVVCMTSKSTYAKASAELDRYIDSLRANHNPRTVIKDLRVIPEQRSRVEPKAMEQYTRKPITEIAEPLTEQWWELTERPEKADKILKVLEGFMR